jgi:FkbM family methyltransferase
LRDFLRIKEINLVLDVGAFVGEYAAELRDLGYRGRIVSFEPVPDSFQRLKERMGSDPLWSGQPFGLSDCSTEALINTYDRGNFNSLLPLRQSAADTYDVTSSEKGRIPIQLKRLDEVFAQLIQGIDSPRTYMKIDTQGNDLNVMRGSQGVFDRFIGLQSEVPAVQIYDGMCSMSQMLAYYAECGFVPIGFYPVNTLGNTQISPEFDVLFTKYS